MKRFALALSGCLFAAAASAPAQSLDDLNIQLHGYATQALLYSTNNNFLTTSSSDGSPAWTEAVVNLSSQPTPKLRVAVQARYYILGNLGNSITMDYAAADYKFSDHLGARFGKVKTPDGLFNEIQDIDPSYLWALLPQGRYLITSRNSQLAHFGGVVYGTTRIGKLGKLEYRGWSGERVVESDDGFFLSFTEAGVSQVNGVHHVINGAALHWITPLQGLMLGASDTRNNQSVSQLSVGAYNTIPHYNQPSYFFHYEKKKIMVAGEYSRVPTYQNISATMNGPDLGSVGADNRPWYVMASYKVTEKLSAGLYQSQIFNHLAALGPSRYQKDWALSARYDFTSYLYAKAEEHFIDGTAIQYDTDLNPDGLKPNSKLTILKVGVSF